MAHKKKNNFVKIHEYPGGKKAFQLFVTSTINYPKLAIENKIEGSVYLEFEVGFEGVVTNAKVVHGIGFGCDEEALRIINLLKYAPQNNHGVKLISKHKVKINFKLPVEEIKKTTTQINYQLSNKSIVKKVAKKNEIPKVSYSYSIKI